MNSSESKHSFIVRIWRERREIEGAPPEWRGMVEHTSSGDRRYFRSLEDLLNFILPYLEGLMSNHNNQ